MADTQDQVQTQPDPSWAAEVTAGYTFAGAAVPLGALVEDDVANAAAQVGLPLAMMKRHGLEPRSAIRSSC